MAKLFEAVCPNCPYISKKILSHAHGKFEEQNKTLKPSIIIINRFIFITNEYYNYIL